jgi:hypothetical protein
LACCSEVYSPFKKAGKSGRDEVTIVFNKNSRLAGVFVHFLAIYFIAFKWAFIHFLSFDICICTCHLYLQILE